MSTIKVDTLQTTSGAGLFPAKAWVNFNGSGVVAIRASGNMSSITDRGTGQYSLNTTVAFADANYSTNLTAGSSPAFTYTAGVIYAGNGTVATSSIDFIHTNNAGTLLDANVFASLHR